MFIRAVLILAVLAFAAPTSATALPSSACTVASPCWNSVPCPAGVQPTVAQVSWSTYKGKTHERRSGRRTVWQLRRVRRIYHAICGLILLQPFVTTCPGNPGGSTATYHVRFLHWTKDTIWTLLRVTETVDGCIILAVDGRPHLGAAGLLGSGLLVP
jgi:hypothetical protein